MTDLPTSIPGLPSAGEIYRAVGAYLKCAYGQGALAPAVQRLIPPETFRPEEWLMSSFVERDPASAPLEAVRSFALRLGNRGYPHMKLRISRPPRDAVYLFSVDSHDAFLRAPEDSPDRRALESLKHDNAAIASTVYAAWEAEHLPTERSYLRRKIEQARGHEAGAQT
jgi:hypothetical protein